MSIVVVTKGSAKPSVLIVYRLGWDCSALTQIRCGRGKRIDAAALGKNMLLHVRLPQHCRGASFATIFTGCPGLLEKTHVFGLWINESHVSESDFRAKQRGSPLSRLSSLGLAVSVGRAWSCVGLFMEFLGRGELPIANKTTF